MTRFFINIRDGETFLEDFEGSLLPDVEAACREAMEAAREILASIVLAGGYLDGQIIEITDESGAMRATFLLRDALNLG